MLEGLEFQSAVTTWTYELLVRKLLVVNDVTVGAEDIVGIR
jgi:hypothetical protein